MKQSQMHAFVTAVSGIAVLTVVVLFRMLPEVKTAAGCVADDAVIRFEFARSIADLDFVFGTSGSACRGSAIAALDAINVLDVWAFIPSYSLFAVFGALFAAQGRWHVLTYGAIAAAVTALVADYVETLLLLSYTPGLAPDLSSLATSSAAAWVKFAALGAHGMLLSLLCFTGSPARRILGALLLLPAAGVALMAWDLAFIQLQGLGFMCGWLALLVVAAREALWPRVA